MIWIVPPEQMAQLVMMVEDGTISRQTARELMEFLIALGLVKRVIGTIVWVRAS